MELSPLAIKKLVELRPPSLNDNTADLVRLRRGLKIQHGLDRVRISLDLAPEISSLLRRWEWRVTA
ncbi:MAG: hypothetical protein JRJ59_04940, partial [Deltaproteobacteria bacterium]|nr:hypothetical protein [Deltaproteobacteria bacterium]